MDLNALNQAVLRLIENGTKIISFLKDFTSSTTKDVSITYINGDGSESVKTFPNIAKMVDTYNITNDSGIIKDANGNVLVSEVNPVFLGDWQSIGGNYDVRIVRNGNGIVTISGLANGGALENGEVLVLPVGFRPKSGIYQMKTNGKTPYDGCNNVRINADGVMYYYHSEHNGTQRDDVTNWLDVSFTFQAEI